MGGEDSSYHHDHFVPKSLVISYESKNDCVGKLCKGQTLFFCELRDKKLVPTQATILAVFENGMAQLNTSTNAGKDLGDKYPSNIIDQSFKFSPEDRYMAKWATRTCPYDL